MRHARAFDFCQSGLDDLDAQLGRLKARKERMEAANQVVSHWGPLSAVPALLKLGVRAPEAERITSAGQHGYAVFEFALIEDAIERLQEIRVGLTGERLGAAPAFEDLTASD